MTAPPASHSDLTVDFGARTATDDSAAIGVDGSTYGTPSDINDPKAQALLKKLGVGYARIALTLADPANPASRVTCAAAGLRHHDRPRRLGADDGVGRRGAGRGNPRTLSPADAAAIVAHINGTGGATRAVSTGSSGTSRTRAARAPALTTRASMRCSPR